MDNNNPTPSQPDPSVIQQPVGEDNKMGLWLLVGLVLVIVVVGGIYWYLSNQQTAQNTPVLKTSTKSTITEENLEEELNSIDAEASGSNDFKAVDSDIQGL